MSKNTEALKEALKTPGIPLPEGVEIFECPDYIRNFSGTHYPSVSLKFVREDGFKIEVVGYPAGKPEDRYIQWNLRHPRNKWSRDHHYFKQRKVVREALPDLFDLGSSNFEGRGWVAKVALRMALLLDSLAGERGDALFVESANHLEARDRTRDRVVEAIKAASAPYGMTPSKRGNEVLFAEGESQVWNAPVSVAIQPTAVAVRFRVRSDVGPETLRQMAALQEAVEAVVPEEGITVSRHFRAV